MSFYYRLPFVEKWLEKCLGSVRFKWYESYLNNIKTELWWLCSFFFLLILSLLFTVKPTNLKISYSWICKKHNETSINFVFYEFKWLLAFTNYTTKNYSKATINVSELILTPFSPFDIKCKKLIVENLWKCIFRVSRWMSFSHFPKFPLGNVERVTLDSI